MNGLEERVIMKISTKPNIEFWHRNLDRAKGFFLNGFVNHYPYFILKTTSRRIILIETKDDDRDNPDSERKCRLGNNWESQAGQGFSYFMILDKKEGSRLYAG